MTPFHTMDWWNNYNCFPCWFLLLTSIQHEHSSKLESESGVDWSKIVLMFWSFLVNFHRKVLINDGSWIQIQLFWLHLVTLYPVKKSLNIPCSEIDACAGFLLFVNPGVVSSKRTGLEDTMSPKSIICLFRSDSIFNISLKTLLVLVPLFILCILTVPIM